MTCSNIALPHTCTAARTESSTVKSVSCFGVTESGNLHILRIVSGCIMLAHIIPSLQMVSLGVPSALEMVLAAPLEVCLVDPLILLYCPKHPLQDHDIMVLSTLERSHHETLHRSTRITMHSNARSVFSQLYRGLMEQSISSPSRGNGSDVLSDLQQTNALLQNTDFGWIEVKVPGSSPGASHRAPGPNGMAACVCTTESGGEFSFLCLLVDASSVSALMLHGPPLLRVECDILSRPKSTVFQKTPWVSSQLQFRRLLTH